MWLASTRADSLREKQKNEGPTKRNQIIELKRILG